MSDRETAAATPPAFAPALGPGSRLGSYEILAPLRAGGMATLFLGRRVGPAGFARQVAIKVVHAHLASDPNFVEMFLDEARLAARIEHPNVVHTEELGEALGMYYLAMEYIHGCTLCQFLARLEEQKRVLAPEIAAHIVMKLADGLHAAHEVKDEAGRALGVVHRDISPQNVLLSYDGQVKLIDFGVAKAAGRSRETAGGFLKGKISYMAPEQAWGREIDRRTDVYALGIVLWECLTQRRLFHGKDDVTTLERVRAPYVQLPSALVPAISLGLDRAVLTALALAPEARFQTAQEFRRAIGHGCAAATLVEPEDLAALLASTMAADIAAETREALEITRTVNAAVLGSSDAISVITRSVGREASDGETPSRVRATLATGAGTLRRERRPRRRWALPAAAALVLLLGVLGAWVSTTSPTVDELHRSSTLAIAPSPTTVVPASTAPRIPMARLAPLEITALAPLEAIPLTPVEIAQTVPVEPVVLSPIASPPVSTTPRRVVRHHLDVERQAATEDDPWIRDEPTPPVATDAPAHVFVPSLLSAPSHAAGSSL